LLEKIKPKNCDFLFTDWKHDCAYSSFCQLNYYVTSSTVTTAIPSSPNTPSEDSKGPQSSLATLSVKPPALRQSYLLQRVESHQLSHYFKGNFTLSQLPHPLQMSPNAAIFQQLILKKASHYQFLFYGKFVEHLHLAASEKFYSCPVDSWIH